MKYLFPTCLVAWALLVNLHANGMEAQIAALQQELAAKQATIDQLSAALQIAQQTIERNRTELNGNARELSYYRREEDARKKQKEEEYRQMVRDAAARERAYKDPQKHQAYFDYN